MWQNGWHIVIIFNCSNDLQSQFNISHNTFLSFFFIFLVFGAGQVSVRWVYHSCLLRLNYTVNLQAETLYINIVYIRSTCFTSAIMKACNKYYFTEMFSVIEINTTGMCLILRLKCNTLHII